MDAQLYKMNLVPREDPVCYPQNESSCVETSSTDVIRRRSSAGKTNCAHDLRDHPCITAQLFENCLHEQRTGGASSKKKQPWIPSFPHQGTNTGDGRYGKAHCRKPRYPALSRRTRRNCTSAQQVLDGSAQGKQGERCHDKEKQWPYAIFGSQACHVRTR